MELIKAENLVKNYQTEFRFKIRAHRDRGIEKNNSILGKTVIMVTHDPQMASYCERIVLLKDGEILDQLDKTNTQDGFYKRIIESMINL